jgi:hypothetical protein
VKVSSPAVVYVQVFVPAALENTPCEPHGALAGAPGATPTNVAAATVKPASEARRRPRVL